MGQIFTAIDDAKLLLGLIRADKLARAVLCALVLIIVAILVVYSVAHANPQDEFFAQLTYQIGVSRDGSWAEIVNYAMAIGAALLFFLASVRCGSRPLLFLCLLMAFICFDDAAEYHEAVGRFLRANFTLPALPGLRRQDTGELLAWTMAAMVLAIPLCFSLWHRRAGDLGLLALMSAPFAMLVVFAVFVDLANAALQDSLKLTTDVIEDGGEMLSIACIVAIAVFMARHGKRYYALAGASSGAPDAK